MKSLGAVVAVVVALAACGSKSSSSSKGPAPAASASEATIGGQAATSDDPALPQACRDYGTAVQTMNNCDKVPPETQERLRTGYRNMRESTADADTKASACKMAIDALRMITNEYCP